MYQDIIAKIRAAIEGVSAIKAIYAYPLPGNPKKYPAVVFFPDAIDNSFETNAENMKLYRFRMWVVVNLGGTDEQEVFAEILPKAVDAVVAALDAAWDGGTSTDGHRMWLLASSGTWGMTIEQKAKEAYAELSIQVKVLTDN